MENFDYKLIDKYLNNDLTKDELLLFNEKLKKDLDFAEEVKLYQEIEQTLTSKMSNYKEENDLRNTLEDLSKEFVVEDVVDKENKEQRTESREQRDVKVFSLRRYTKFIAVAASVVFIVSIFMLNGKPDYNDFANHQQLELVVRGTTDEHLINAQQAFNLKDYTVAEKEFRTVLYADSLNTEVQLYLGISLLEQGKFELAENTFSAIKNGTSIYKNKAIWYLALSKLKQKDYKTCKEILKLVTKDAEDYKNARKLLKKL